MSFDNLRFDMNGPADDPPLLLAALKLVAMQRGSSAPFSGWSFDPHAGFVIHWHLGPGINPFPEQLTAEGLAPLVTAWLSTPDARGMDCEERDSDIDHDGHNDMGWRLYAGDYSPVGRIHSALCAIRRVFVWYGK